MMIDELTVAVHVRAMPGDPVFDGLAATSMVWLPEHGMGFLPVSDAPYDAAYFAKYERYAATSMGEAITRARANLVQRHMERPALVIDVGIGCGDFLSEMVCDGYTQTYGADVNPAAVAWLEARGRLVDPYQTAANALTFWDSLEHIPDVHLMIESARRWVFCSLPIVPGDGPPPRGWKHLRRDEHCWYFTRRGFIGWMDAQGFECVECNAMETLLGREDIETFVFRRRV